MAEHREECSAGSTASASALVEKLTINRHTIGPAAAAALRAMPSLRELELVPDVIDPVANGIDGPVATQLGDEIAVRSWVISSKRLICRVIRVRKGGDTLREAPRTFRSGDREQIPGAR